MNSLWNHNINTTVTQDLLVSDNLSNDLDYCVSQMLQITPGVSQNEEKEYENELLPSAQLLCVLTCAALGDLCQFLSRFSPTL